MTQQEFDELLFNGGFSVVVWDATRCYKVVGINNNERYLSLEDIHEYWHETLNESNCENFHYKLSGEMKAVLALAQTAVKDNLRDIFNNI
jgi:hypothetical protein